MAKRFSVRAFIISLSITGAGAYGLNRWSGLNFWICWGIAVAAVLVNGIVMTVEDRMPGGLDADDDSKNVETRN